MARKSNQRLRALDKKRAAPRPTGGTRPPYGKDMDDQPLEAAVFVMTSFIGLVILLTLAVIFGIRSIESDLEQRAEEVLRGMNVSQVKVTASANDLRLLGTVEDEELIANAFLVVGQLEGVGEVSGEIAYIAPREVVDVQVVSDPLVVTWGEDTAVVTGTMSDQARVDTVAEIVAKVFPSSDSSGLTVKEGIPVEDAWLSAVLRLVETVGPTAPVGEVIVNSAANVIKVSAEYETRQEQRDVKGDVEDILAAVTFDFSSGLTVKDAERPTREQVEEVQQSLDELLEGKVVEFEFGSDVITAEGEALLNEILIILRQQSLVPIEIAGHTDSIGSEQSNLGLSERRAEAVLAYLVANGEDPERFAVVGYGETRPVASNATAEGQAQNRRIEFIALEE